MTTDDTITVRSLCPLPNDHSCCGPHRSCTDCRRGIVCHRCNMVLGLVRDDPTLLAALGDYLRGSK